MDCHDKICKTPIKKNEPCYQLRFGGLDDNEEFIADHDVGYYHEGHSPPDAPSDTLTQLVITRADVKEELKTSIDREPTEEEVDKLIANMVRDMGQWITDCLDWYLKNELE
jgi:hypothetical protein